MTAAYDNLVAAAQPKLDEVHGYATEGTDWRWTLQVNVLDPTTGKPVDLTGATGVCTIADQVGGTTLLTPAVGCGPGTITIVSSAANNSTSAGPQTQFPTLRQCVWSLVLTLPSSDGRKVQVFGPDPFVIYQAVTS